MLLEGDGALRVRGQAGVVDRNDVGGRGEGGGDDEGVVRRFTRAEVERFKAAVCEPAVEGGGDSANGVLEEGEPRVEARGVECRGAHEDILKGREKVVGTKPVGNEKGEGWD